METQLKEMVWSKVMDRHIPSEDAYRVYDIDDVDGDLVTREFRDENYRYTIDDDRYHPKDDVYHCEVSQEFYSTDDDFTHSYCGDYGHEGSFSDSDYYWIDRGVAADHWLWYEHATYCTDIDDSVHENDATYCDVDGENYYDTDNMPGSEYERNEVQEYHSSKNYVENLNSKYHGYNTQFNIGFEIEKNVFHTDNGDASDTGDQVGWYDLFAGFETDSSCGVEAVTHILPLGSPRSKARLKVFDMMDEASKVINSPKDITCGGHITVSVNGMKDGYELVDKMREKLAILYALYRYRLKRTYCCSNKGIKKDNNVKYAPVHVKGCKVEFRIPSAVANVKQLKLRYDLMYKIMHHSFERRVHFEVFLSNIRHIIKKMYNGNDQKVDAIFELAHHFRRYLIVEETSSNINEFINHTNEE